MQWCTKPTSRWCVWATIILLLLCMISYLTYHTLSLDVGARFAFHTSRFLREKNTLKDVLNSTLGFEKIYVINLPSRDDYRDAMSLAAHLSGLVIEYVDGVTDVDRRTLPPGSAAGGWDDGALGAWRAHMNALRRMVEQNVTSALVLEGDVDWDIRLKRQMKDIAQASRLLIQPLKGTSDQYLDPSRTSPKKRHKPMSFDISSDLAKTEVPSSSPYGDIDKWDLLWLGHCGTTFPHSDSRVPLARVAIRDVETVPEPQHIEIQFGNHELHDQYPAHTRVVSRVHGNFCTLGYGISLPGARRFLYELTVRKLSGPADFMFQNLCQGANGRTMRTCLTVQPQIFQEHRPVGNRSTFSDIADHGQAYNEFAFTRNIRWSTRLNFETLLDGRTDYVDLFKDGEKADPDLDFG